MLDRADLDAEFYQEFESACRKIIWHPEYMQQAREERRDHQILNIATVNYLRENPFFRTLNNSALQRLATTVELAEFSQGDDIMSSIAPRHVAHMASPGILMRVHAPSPNDLQALL